MQPRITDGPTYSVAVSSRALLIVAAFVAAAALLALVAFLRSRRRGPR